MIKYSAKAVALKRMTRQSDRDWQTGYRQVVEAGMSKPKVSKTADMAKVKADLETVRQPEVEPVPDSQKLTPQLEHEETELEAG